MNGYSNFYPKSEANTRSLFEHMHVFKLLCCLLVQEKIESKSALQHCLLSVRFQQEQPSKMMLHTLKNTNL